MSEDEREPEREEESDSAPGDDPFAELDVDADDDSDPFAELDDAPLGERTPATDDDLFEEMDREELAEEDRVVERVLEGEEVDTEAPESAPAAGPLSNGPEGTDGSAPPASADAEATPERDEVVVPKRRYCEGCQYFSDPPETACEHVGTDILELVDSDHFLVADCPVVEWRRDLDAYPDPGEAAADPRE